MNLIATGMMIAAVMVGAEMRPGPPEEMTNEALSLLQAGDTAAGVAALEQTVKLHPAYLPAYVSLGQALLETEPERARLFGKEVLRVDPDNAGALDVLSRSFERARAGGLGRDGELRLRALEIGDYGALLSQRPEHPEVLYRIASQRLALERLLPPEKLKGRRNMLDAAVAELARLRGILGRDGDARLRAAAHFQSGRAIKHLGDLERSLGNDPAAPYADAIGQFEAALDLEPQRIDALGEIVLINRATGARDAAAGRIAAHLDKIDSDPVRAKVLSMLGNLEIEAGDSDAGSAHLEQAIALNPQLMDAYLGLYRAYSAGGRTEEAVSSLQRAIAAEPGFLMGNLLIGQIRTQQKRYDDAIRAYENVLRVAPAEATVLGMIPSKNLYRNRLYYDAASRLAWLLLRHANDPASALEMSDRAQTFAPAEPYLLDTIGSAHIERGEFAEAKRILADVVSKNSNIASAHFHLAQAELGLGNRIAAREAVTRALSFDEPFFQREQARQLRRELHGG